MYFAIIVPWVINAIFQAGLHSWTLYIAASTIPISFIGIFLVLLEPGLRDVVHLVASACASILAAMSGLIAMFHIDPDSISDIIVLASFMISGFIAVYLDVLGKNDMALRLENGSKRPRLYVQGAGFVIPVLAMGIGREFFHLDAWLFFIASAGFILAPVARLRGTNRVTQEANAITNAQPNIAIKTSLAVLAIMFFFSTFTFSLIINVDVSSRALPGYIGIATGVVIAFIAGKKAWLARSAVLPGILCLYVIIVLDPPFVSHAWFVMLAGFLPGLIIGEISLHAYLLPRSSKKSSEGWYLFALLIIAIFAAAGANYFPDLLNSLQSIHALGLSGLLIPLFFFTALAVVALSIGTSTAARKLFHDVIKNVPTPGPAMTPRRKNTITAIMLAMVVAGPLIATGMYLDSHYIVNIKLDHVMYDVNGNAVTEVDMAPMTAKILFNFPNPTNGTSHGELIRQGMSVRLGGYYYGYYEPLDSEANSTFTKADVINWVANNNDVFSFGFCGLSGNDMTPADIATIKTMNPQARFYYMAFATTLFENPGSNNTGPTWGGTHYPSVGFNDTIRGYTLKLANGSEALGVRRDSVNSTAHLMDLGNPGWAKYFAWIYENRSKQFHANGIATDEVMWEDYWNIHDWNQGQTLLNYSSDKKTERDQVHQTCYEWLQRVKGNLSVDFITQAFWPQAQLFQDGVWGEISFRSTGGQYGDAANDLNKSVWYEGMTWEQIIKNARDVACGNGVKNQSYIWAAWYQRNNAASLEYAISTYLMAKPNNLTSLVFHPQPVYNGGYPANLAGYAVETVKSEVQRWPQYFNIKLGDALEEMQLKSGIGGQYYERHFENGIVLVNPFHAHIPGF